MPAFEAWYRTAWKELHYLYYGKGIVLARLRQYIPSISPNQGPRAADSFHVLKKCEAQVEKAAATSIRRRGNLEVVLLLSMNFPFLMQGGFAFQEVRCHPMCTQFIPIH